MGELRINHVKYDKNNTGKVDNNAVHRTTTDGGNAYSHSDKITVSTQPFLMGEF